MAFSIRIDDQVEVIAGRRRDGKDQLDDQGRRIAKAERTTVRGRVIAVDRERGLVTVEGHNVRTKHVKKSPQHPNGGLLRREAPIAISNVKIVTDGGKAVRLSRAARKEGKVVERTTGDG